MMNKDSSVGRVMTLDQAMVFWIRCQEAEKVMGKLSYSERMVILKTIGKDITLEDLADKLRSKKILVIKRKSDENKT